MSMCRRAWWFVKPGAKGEVGQVIVATFTPSGVALE
jgi:hypothetical protein